MSININMISTVDFNWPSTICQKWNLWCQLSTSNWHHVSTVSIKLMLHIDKRKFQPKFIFKLNFVSPNICASDHFSRHVLDVIFTSCVDVHIFAIWHLQDVKIRSIDMPWYNVLTTYWHKFEVPLPTWYYYTSHKY